MSGVPSAEAASRPAIGHFGQLYGGSAAIRSVYAMVEKVAPTPATVFVVGESGSGKELVARTIHDRSERRRGPFIAINCGAIPANLIEAELFGHEKGAFTGASRQHRGCFERAAGGTLFLDEITEMAPEMQVRLLRVLETGRFVRVGGDGELNADVRIIAATNRDPQTAVREGRLREDLMYRLAVFPINLPTLSEREGDAELIAELFLSQLNDRAGSSKRFSRSALSAIRDYSWPGNVRELKNAVQRAFIMAEDVVEMNLGQLAGREMAGASLKFPVGTSLAEMEKQAIYATLDHCKGNKRRCAEILGVSLKTLYNRLAAYQNSEPRMIAL
ncbi:MAG TPA: sigma-54 dependent transcriptional regulator [Casimicrobiaceae bacterium]|nr:sigma-54 dependent transcriptional regulator [Casimicrobiaceae bacterium]